MVKETYIDVTTKDSLYDIEALVIQSLIHENDLAFLTKSEIKCVGKWMIKFKKDVPVFTNTSSL